ncbi:MAG: hypothetical protein E7635_01845 [Ruminococcaceae bacterium]|nr:hypothetical protein [Oscillospiraceae bacterium]
MKKVLSVFLALAMLFSMPYPVFAASSSDTQLEHRLTCNGETLYKAEPGEVITVTLSLENKTADKGFTIKNFQAEIYYDTDFFEYVGDITIDSESANSNWNTQETIHHSERRVCLNIITDRNAMLECESSHKIAAFKLKVKDGAAIGSQGTVKCRMDDVYAFGPDYKEYGESSVVLTVIVEQQQEETESYTITYMNDGKVFETATATPNTVMAKAPVKSDKRFLGWEDESGKLWQPDEVYTATKESVFTAKWGELLPPSSYTLTFVTNGGSTIAPVTKTDGTVLNLANYTTVRTGYTFDGWYDSSDLDNKLTNITLTSDTTVYAGWVKNVVDDDNDKPSSGGASTGSTRYTITFETNGGSDINAVKKVKNTIVDLSKYIPEKEGFIFEGWYTDKALTNKVDKIQIKSNVKLYAKWSEGETEVIIKPNYKPDILTDEHYAYIQGRNDSMIHPTANLTRAEAATIFFRLLNDDIRRGEMTSVNAFTDVNKGDWYNTAVSTLASLEILKGRSTDAFAPNDPITRAEFTTIVARLSEAEYNGKNLFNDIDGHWAENYINIAASIGWVNGHDGLFRPDDNIIRAEVMTLVNRVLNRVPETVDDLLDNMTKWADNSDVSAWYYIAVQEATNSHEYKMKDGRDFEKWTKLVKNPDWSEFEN